MHESIEAGNINEKLAIQLDTDLRYGEVRLNNQLLHAKLVDLPTIIESYKTADNTNLYKTADICQLLVCNRERPRESEKDRLKQARGSCHTVESNSDTELERTPHKKSGKRPSKQIGKPPEKPSPKKPGRQPKKQQAPGKRAVRKQSETQVEPKDAPLEEDKENRISPILESNRDFLKVDEKYLWPHGLTPPCRNLRRRRLNNALKDKNVEPPEPDILREVKYLLRMDNEAVRVDYEVINESGMIPGLNLSDTSSGDELTDEAMQ